MFSATLGKEVRATCKKFMQNVRQSTTIPWTLFFRVEADPAINQPLEIYVDDETKLTLHGLQQYYVKLEEKEKNRKLNDLLDSLEFNQVCCAKGATSISSAESACFQVCIFVKSVARATQLDKLLQECNFPSICIHSGLTQEQRCVVWTMMRVTGNSVVADVNLPFRPLVSSGTSNSRRSRSASSSPRISSAVESILSGSTSLSTTTNPRTPTHTSTVLGAFIHTIPASVLLMAAFANSGCLRLLVALAVSEPAVSPLRSSPARRTKRS